MLTAPPTPALAEGTAHAAQPEFGRFRRDLTDETLHWGEGMVAPAATQRRCRARAHPGPDCKRYLAPEFVQTEADFLRLKPKMLRVGDVKTFENFIVPMPASADPTAYSTVIAWCESFGQFIAAAQYR